MHDVKALLRECDRARAYTDELWKDLTPDEVTWRPHENFSAIGWDLGHQAHVAHFMIRNLAAAEPSPDPALDSLMDSALPERFRGALPAVRRLSAFATPSPSVSMPCPPTLTPATSGALTATSPCILMRKTTRRMATCLAPTFRWLSQRRSLVSSWTRRWHFVNVRTRAAPVSRSAGCRQLGR